MERVIWALNVLLRAPNVSNLEVKCGIVDMRCDILGTKCVILGMTCDIAGAKWVVFGH